MSTRCTTPQASAAGSTRCATLWVPKVTVTSALTCGPSTAPVSTSTPDGMSTATTGTPGSAASAAAASSRRPRPPADADDAVDHDVGRGRPLDASTTRPPGGAQRGEARGAPGRGEQQRLDPHAAPGEQRAGVQRVAAVVAAPTSSSTRAPYAGRAGRATARPARPRPAASARPRAAAPSAPPRPRGPARRCVRCACRQPYPAPAYGGPAGGPRRTHGHVISAQTASRIPSEANT